MKGLRRTLERTGYYFYRALQDASLYSEEIVVDEARDLVHEWVDKEKTHNMHAKWGDINGQLREIYASVLKGKGTGTGTAPVVA